jgi:tetratricopeptide (TPR) repeat protein
MAVLAPGVRLKRGSAVLDARRLALLALLAAAVLAAVSRDRLAALEASPRAGGEELLYLPNGKHLKAMSLGHASLAADLVYVWAIQYYSDYDRADRFRFVEHVFGSVIPDLDPHYVDPYWLGAMILTVEAGDLEAGLRVLDKGFENNPAAWVLPYLAGFECYRVHQYERAADYFDRSSRAPGAPALPLRMKAGIVARKGDLRESIRLWDELLRDPRGDAASKGIAERQIRDLTVQADLADLAAAIAAYRERADRLPQAIQDLVRAGLLRAAPVDPDGHPYLYDPATGRAGCRAGGVLGAR